MWEMVQLVCKCGDMHTASCDNAKYFPHLWPTIIQTLLISRHNKTVFSCHKNNPPYNFKYMKSITVQLLEQHLSAV